MWDEIGEEVAREFPDVTWDKMLVDAMTMRMTMKPESLDTIVASNLHADILSDLAAALAGLLGIAPTANSIRSAGFPRCSSRFTARRSIAARDRRSDRLVLDRLDDAGTSRRKGRGGRLMRAIERATADPLCTRPTSAAPRRRAP